MKLFFFYYFPKGLYFQINERNLRKYSVVLYFKVFSKNNYLADPVVSWGTHNPKSFPFEELILLYSIVCKRVLIIFFGLPVDPFKSNRLYFSARYMIIYAVLIVKKNISAFSFANLPL